MRAVRIFAHCQKCHNDETYIILSNETDSMYRQCSNCKITMLIDQINLIYNEDNGDKVEEMVFIANK